MPDRPEVQAVLPAGPGQGPGRQDLAAGPVEDRRRHRLGLGLLRPRAEPDLLRHRQPRRVEPRAAARRQQVDLRHLRPRPRHRRGRLVLPVEPARPLRPRRHQREHPARPARSTAGSREGPRPPRAQRLRLRPGPRDRARCSRPTPFVRITAQQGRGPEDRPADPQRRRRSRRSGKVIRDVAPIAAGAKDWQPSRLLAADRAALHPAPDHVDGLRGRRGELHRRHALRRRERQDVRRPGRPRRRQPRRVHRLGPGRARRRSGGSRRSSPSGAGRWRRPATSSSTARWTAGSRRSTPRPARCCGSSRPTPESSASRSTYRGPGRQAVRGDPVRRRRLGRGDRLRRPGPARPDRRPSGSSTR